MDEREKNISALDIQLQQLYRSLSENKHILITSILYGTPRRNLEDIDSLAVAIATNKALPRGGITLYLGLNGEWHSNVTQFDVQDDGYVFPSDILECYATITEPVCQGYDRRAWSEVDRRDQHGKLTVEEEFEILEQREILVRNYTEENRLTLARNLNTDLGRIADQYKRI